MSATEQEILRSLVKLENAVKEFRIANPKPDLQPMLARIDELTAQLPHDAAPELIHYLQRKSYEKARVWLEGSRGKASAGGCR